MEWQKAFENMATELEQVQEQLSDPVVIANQNLFRELSQRYGELASPVEMYREYEQARADAEEAQALLAESEDGEMQEFLQTEVQDATIRAEELHQKLLVALIPKDPLDRKGVIVEIRAGTGGDEAALFAGDLFDMYQHFAERQGWKLEVLGQSLSEMGGFKEVIFAVDGPGAYGTLKYESGVHRVQRVPETESQGRIHTSAATVAVLPEAEEIDVELDPGDLKTDVFRAGGPGGQHMQKNETAVRITHAPTGISVTCSDQRSQRQNRERALRLLRAKLYEQERQRHEQELAAQRREQVKSGDRSEKIRTYNFPQDRLTDHRIGLTLHNLPAILSGEIDELIEALREYENQQRLADLTEA